MCGWNRTSDVVIVISELREHKAFVQSLGWTEGSVSEITKSCHLNRKLILST